MFVKENFELLELQIKGGQELITLTALHHICLKEKASFVFQFFLKLFLKEI